MQRAEALLCTNGSKSTSGASGSQSQAIAKPGWNCRARGWGCPPQVGRGRWQNGPHFTPGGPALAS